LPSQAKKRTDVGMIAEARVVEELRNAFLSIGMRSAYFSSTPWPRWIAAFRSSSVAERLVGSVCALPAVDDLGPLSAPRLVSGDRVGRAFVHGRRDLLIDER
jgi:hypothetical protein